MMPLPLLLLTLAPWVVLAVSGGATLHHNKAPRWECRLYICSCYFIGLAFVRYPPPVASQPYYLPLLLGFLAISLILAVLMFSWFMQDQKKS